MTSSTPKPFTYSISDATEYLKRFPNGYLTGIATSPPYNKHFNKRTLRHNASNWQSSAIMGEGYDTYTDNMPEGEYVEWQNQFLLESVRVVGDDGVVLYNIGRRIQNLKEDRRDKILDGVDVRQTIIWNRGSTNNQGGSRPTIFPPIYELIYVIAGRNWKLPDRHVAEMRYWGDVWRIPFETKNEHPAPFPVALAERMVMACGDKVCDPFAGSGTIGIAAIRCGVEYYLNDISEKYKEMFERRLADQGNVLAGWKESVLGDDLDSETDSN